MLRYVLVIGGIGLVVGRITLVTGGVVIGIDIELVVAIQVVLGIIVGFDGAGA